MNKIILAIDGGATKTALTVCDQDGFEFYSSTTSSSNYQAIGQKNVIEVITNLLTDAANNLHDWHIDAAVFAIAGIDTSEDIQIVRHIIEQSIVASPLKIESYVIENDVEATLKGLSYGKSAALLISGTGSIAYGFDGDKLYRVGGWGHRAGDEGSGYWIGQQVARAIFKALDGRGPQTVLTDLILAKTNLKTADQLANFLYNDTYTNARLAGLSTVLQHAYDLNDEVATTIAEQACAELTLLAETILQRIKLCDPFTFYLNGGVLKNNTCIYERIVTQLQLAYPHVQFALCHEQPLYYLIARAKLLMLNEEAET